MKKILLSAVAMSFAFFATGQTFTNMTSILNSPGGGSPCVVDMNSDGLDDVVSVSGSNLYIDYQQTDGTFNEVTYNVGFNNSPSWSISAGDIDGNGYNDLMFGGGSAVSFVYANNDGTAYNEVYINDFIFSQRTNFADIDVDGNLDAFACHDIDQSHPYRNDGSGNLVEDQSLLPTIDITGNYASVFVDFDNDGDQDMYLTKCSGGNPAGHPANANGLYVNNGDGTWTQDAATYGLWDDERSWVTVFEDFDNDGDFDSYTVNHSSQNFLKENDGTGHFTDVTAGSGIVMNDLGSWAAIAADFDNDGHVDILSESDVNAEFYHNDGDGTFTAMASNTMTNTGSTFNKGGLGDLNNDGFIDIWTGGTLWMNDGNANNWIKVALEGTTSNRNGIGARIEAYGDWPGMKLRESRSGENFKPMSSLDVFIGLGTFTEVDSVVITWPNGNVDVVYDPPINSEIQVIESGAFVSEEVKMTLKAFLEGPYQAGTGLMLDQMRVDGKIPTTEPFTQLGFTHKDGGGEVISAGVLDVSGTDAAVDWIFVEIRDGNNPNNVHQTKSCLIKSDGMLMDVTGDEELSFNLPVGGNFNVVLRHKNHHGFRTDSPTSNSPGTLHVLDLSNGSIPVLGGANALVDEGGVKLMITGDANKDGQVNFVDKNDQWRLQNGTPFDYFEDPADFNLDGFVNSADKNGAFQDNQGKIEQLD